jgi:hypothetical protein
MVHSLAIDSGRLRFPALSLFFCQPMQLMFQTVVVMGVLAFAGIWAAAMALVVEVTLWTLFARAPLGRRWIAERTRELARRRLISGLDGYYRRELVELEAISTSVRALADPPREAAQLDALLESYVALAKSCSARHQLLTLAIVPAPQLAAVPDKRPRSARVEMLHANRAEIAALHKELVQKSRAGVEELEQQLALIADSVRLIQQHAIANSCNLDIGTLAHEVHYLAASVRQAADSHASAVDEVEAIVHARVAE